MSKNAKVIGVCVVFIVSCTMTSSASTVRETYMAVESIISGPDTVPAGTDFDIYVEGNTIGGTSTDIYAYYLYENAEWYYDTAHRVVIISGSLVDESVFNWGAHYDHTYTFNRPGGTYRYTFIYGWRSGMHGWYDCAVELDVASVEEVPAESCTTVLIVLLVSSIILIRYKVPVEFRHAKNT